jgi:hypothetical protein
MSTATRNKQNTWANMKVYYVGKTALRGENGLYSDDSRRKLGEEKPRRSEAQLCFGSLILGMDNMRVIQLIWCLLYC